MRHDAIIDGRAFFYRHAGYSYDPRIESRDAGRRQCARSLADAETWARTVGMTFEWEWDDRPWDGDSDPPPSEVLGCIAKWRDGSVAASLWGIGDPSAAYRRVIEAELACEAKSDMLLSLGTAL